ncbi:MAG: hypothetical protein KDD78_20075 [Caldilineaceae bacterium]|nr:hypothetical protein [Caldilineaceae bacterium]
MSQIEIAPSQNRIWLWEYLETELLKSNAFLLPLRLFIGLGWLRAGVEKLIDPLWWSGDKVTAFFEHQIAIDAVYFPFYDTLITQVFAPGALALSWIILIGELLVGMSILTGALTNLGLLAGIFMNLKFVLAGVVNPSAFYIVIQAVLLSANSGAVLGIDSVLARYSGSFLIAQPHSSARGNKPSRRRISLVGGILCALAALLAVPYIRDFGPHSVDDPAMLLFILLSLGAMLLGIHFVRMSARLDEVQG